MVRNWQRWIGLFLVLGVVVIMTTGGCLEFGAKDDEPATTTGTSGTSYSYFISGKVTVNGTALQSVTMSLSGSKTDSTSTDQNGNYTFLVNNGNYIITPSKTDYSFSPGSMALSINGSSWNGVNFSASTSVTGGTTYTISGTVSNVGSGATVMLSGPSAATTMTDANGNYTFSGLANGSYTVSASKQEFSVTPNNLNITVNGANQTGINFTGSAYTGTTYTIAGRVATSTSAGVGDVMVVLSGQMYITVFTNQDGYYTFSNIQSGSYTISPDKEGYYFDPSNTAVYVTGNLNNYNFTASQAQANTYTIYGQLRGDGSLVSYQSVNLTGAGVSRSTMTDFSGSYSFPGLPNGSYTINPAVMGYSGEVATVPDYRSVTINGADSYGNDFDVATAFSISGSITYNGAKTGQMFISLDWDGGGETNWGTCIDWMTPLPSTRSYTIRGVKPGAYKLSARLDSIGDFDAAPNASDPRGASSTVDVTGQNVTNANLTVLDPTAPATATPIADIMAIPGDQSVLLFWGTPENENGEETAARYNISWGENPAITPSDYSTCSGTAFAFASEDGHFFKTGLTNGTVYYFAATSQTGGIISAPSPVISVTAGAPTGGYTVSGQVTMPVADTLIENKPLIIGLYADNAGGGAPTIFMNSYLIPSPCPVQWNYSVAGVTNGSYYLFYVIDINGDGVINSGDYQNNEGGDVVVVNGANVTKNTTVATGKVIANARTGHYRDNSGDNYNVDLRVMEGKCTPVRVTLLNGPNVFGPEDLGNDWDFHTWVDMRSARPNVDDTYTFEVGFANGTTETVTAAVTNVLDAFAINLDATGGITPTFTWAPPSPAPSFTYTYQITVSEEIQDYSGWTWYNDIWRFPEDSEMPSSQTSVVFDVDGSAWDSIRTGNTYNWRIMIRDEMGNTSTTSAMYNP